MTQRKTIKIDEDKCNGCGLRIPNCPEGALHIIDKKARVISDLFCDGLGACIGHCPEGAITIEEREAVPYDEIKVMENVIKQGKNVIKAHLQHLKDHGEEGYYGQAIGFLKIKGIDVMEGDLKPKPCGCPGSKMIDMRAEKEYVCDVPAAKGRSEVRQWPVQITLVPPHAPYFNGADILIAADCVPFAYPDFHSELLKGKILLVGCPKLDDLETYREKISAIVKDNDVKSVTYAHMEVPCCSGLLPVIEEAIEASGKNIPFSDITITIKGEKAK